MIINSQAFNARGADARRINIKTAYAVDFVTEELVQKAIHKLDAHLHVSKIFYKVQTGVMNQIKSKETLTKGEAFKEKDSRMVEVDMSFNNTVKYDLIGKIVEETGLTRSTVVKILTGITSSCFEQFKYNPEEFILKASKLINEEKATEWIAKGAQPTDVIKRLFTNAGVTK